MSQIHLSWCRRVVHIPSHFQRRYFCPKNKNFQKHEELVISPWNEAVVLSALVFQVLLVVDTASGLSIRYTQRVKSAAGAAMATTVPCL